MENTSSLGLVRTKSDQLMEKLAEAFKSPMSSNEANGVVGESGSTTLSRKSSKQTLTAPSPGRGSGRNTHIRKSRSAQLKLDLDDLGSGAALSRASSASLGLSFSFTGFTVPPDEIADSKPFSDEDIPDDVEAGTRKARFQTEPTMPIHLKFTDVTYKVIIKGLRTNVEKEILNGITGFVNPGEVLALMGPSGSGKTTLLNLLGGRLIRSTVGGSVHYNDQPYNKFLKSRIGFVMQEDVLFPHLTVKETLRYAALLRLPNTLTKEQKEKRAIDVIYELGLERCQDTMIGGTFVRGVSGGERRRVCIGNEILINPSLLFLDEPTSGLDSTTALRIVQILHEIAEAGKTVVTTIHQPSSRLFHKFDKLILLGKGSLLYYGKAAEAMNYFSSIGCSPLIAMNPAEFLLDLANGNLNDVSVPSELEDKVQIENSEFDSRQDRPSPALVQEYLVEAYEAAVAEKEKRKMQAAAAVAVEEEEVSSKAWLAKRQWGASWWEQYSILFRRGIKERRHEYFSWLRVTQVLATAVILGLLWWRSETTTPKGLQDQAGLLFFIAVFWGFFPVFTAIFTFPQERAMLSKERAADMYRLSAYFLARTTSDLPLDLLLPVLFLLVVYFMAGLRLSAAPFFLTMVTVFLCIVAAQVYYSLLRLLLLLLLSMDLIRALFGAGPRLGYWSYPHGCQEGHNAGLRHRHDLHACWWILCTESSSVCILDPLFVFQLSHIQAPSKGAVQQHHTFCKRYANGQRSSRSYCSNRHGFRVSSLGLHIVEEDETIRKLIETECGRFSQRKICYESNQSNGLLELEN